ncbi:heme A synthase [Vogesella sp. LIG4]|uniref:COX15/CtaA family protein n=1 Tax=Vogesella sp. LIG4 TaxID=1192162 RepID=UPI0008201D2A|nr:COX15/CtaA family protein [Vogesella sp. LIG4]SCK13944.1 cytochrome c oxidase assembly protein subunit 15 [Vogesella sp. LIG4]
MKRLLLFALLLACIVVPLGAYVRLSDAGLGCPDWPGCYGHLSPHHAADDIRQAMAVQPDGPVSPAKAWKEMTHRYLAATLGLLVLCTAIVAWRQRRHRLAASGLLALLVLQGLLGMWTVTLLLKPAVVTAHLLGGMSIVSLLAASRFAAPTPRAVPRRVGWLLWLLPLLVLAQIALGGWVSSNYAALACQGFPSCNGSYLPDDMQFAGAFHWQRVLGESADGSPLLFSQLTAIHWLHRLGALLLTLLLLAAIQAGWRVAALRPRLRLLAAALVLQLLLGAANVLLQLPLPVAVAHNIGAMLLLASTMSLAFSVRPQVMPQPRAVTIARQRLRKPRGRSTTWPA